MNRKKKKLLNIIYNIIKRYKMALMRRMELKYPWLLGANYRLIALKDITLSMTRFNEQDFFLSPGRRGLIQKSISIKSLVCSYIYNNSTIRYTSLQLYQPGQTQTSLFLDPSVELGYTLFDTSRSALSVFYTYTTHIYIYICVYQEGKAENSCRVLRCQQNLIIQVCCFIRDYYPRLLLHQRMNRGDDSSGLLIIIVLLVLTISMLNH